MKKSILIFLTIVLLFTGCSSNTNKEEIISSEDKEKYYNTILMYLRDVITKMNDEVEYNYKSTDTMLFIPAGNKITCVSDNVLESPFSKTWKYIYVGVYYNGEEYLYSIASKDGENYGLDLITESELLLYNYNNIDKIKEDNIKEFIDNYKEKASGNKIYSINEVSNHLKEFIKSNYPKVKTIVLIDAYECTY